MESNELINVKAKLEGLRALVGTHSSLVKLACSWLGFTKGCNPVFAEKGSTERPDAIGWRSSESMVVECKSSASDFRADKNKPCRNSVGLGNRRYFMMTEELYSRVKDEIPLGWGVVLADLDTGHTRQVSGCRSKIWESDVEEERDFLRCRVLDIQGFGKGF